MTTRVEVYVLFREIPAVLGVSRARVYQLLKHPSFPAPETWSLNGVPLWRLSALKVWDKTRNRKGGRPRSR